MHHHERILLKLCPFCGGKPMEFVQDSKHVIKCNFGSKGGQYAGCGAQILAALTPPVEWESAVVRNREAWNKRI